MKISRSNYLHLTFYSVLLAFVLASCGEQPIYQETSAIEGTWNYADSIIFQLPAPDTTQGYGMVLKLAHTKDYPFENLYIKIGTVYPSGRYTTNLMNVDLADKSGAWYGHCSGSNCELSVTLREFFSFSESGSYTISMQQYTRSENLVGMRGLELELWQSYRDQQPQNN